MKLALRLESGTWTNTAWQRRAYIRRRFYAVALLCLILCGCVVWPSVQYGPVRIVRDRERGLWFVFWEMWGTEYHVQTTDRAAAVLLEALIWARGRGL